MQCPMCQDPNARFIKAGVSKKTGKAYDSFIACDACGFKGQDENGTKNIVVDTVSKTPKTTPLNAYDRDMRLSYRKDLMVAVLTKAPEGATSKIIIEFFKELWSEVEK